MRTALLVAITLTFAIGAEARDQRERLESFEMIHDF